MLCCLKTLTLFCWHIFFEACTFPFAESDCEMRKLLCDIPSLLHTHIPPVEGLHVVFLTFHALSHMNTTDFDGLQCSNMLYSYH